MDDTIGYIIVAFIIIGLTYGLVRQIKHILTIQKDKADISNYKRSLFGYYLACGSLMGFLISFILNVLVAMELIQSNLVESNTTALSCFIFLAAYLMTKWVVLPRNRDQYKLLKR